MNLIELKQKVNCEISTDHKEINLHKRDASIFEITPQAIAYPKNTKELQTLVRFCYDRKGAYPDLSLTARGAGTDMTGGSIGEGIIVDFTKYFKGLMQIKSPQVSVQPGMYFREFAKFCELNHLCLPVYPTSSAYATLGGMVSNNCGGEKSLKYGKINNFVTSLEVVLANGETTILKPLNRKELSEKFKQSDFEGQIYKKLFFLLDENFDIIQSAKPKVSKNSAGYPLWEVWNKEIFDLSRLFIGAQGTLGLITQINCQLMEPTPYSRLLTIFVKDASILGDLISTILKFDPDSLESLDVQTLKIGLKFAPALFKATGTGRLKLLTAFIPELKHLISGGLPQVILLAEFSGTNEAAALKTLNNCQKEITSIFPVRTTTAKSSPECDKYWLLRRDSYNVLRQKIKNLRTAPFIDDLIVPLPRLPEFLPKLKSILNHYPELQAITIGHAGDANFHIIPLLNLENEHDRELIPHLASLVYDLVLECEGSTSGEHNDGLIRGQYLEKMYGSQVFGLMKEVKEILDPKNIFNPGKKTQSTWQYAMDKIRA